MYFANPWGLLGLLALPAIVGIHIYHRRFPPLVVAGMHLWGPEVETRSAGRRRDRLPITATLLLELLAALLLAIALARPVVGGMAGAEHLVVVLDDSASMQARPAGEDSFRNRALAELEARVQELPRRSVVTVVLTGRRPQTLTEPQKPWSDVAPLLEDWAPRQPRHDFQPAWDLAGQLAADAGRLLFLTDDLPDEDDPSVRPPENMEIVSFGQPLDNVAITAAHWELEPIVQNVGGEDASRPETVGYRGRIHVRVGNFGRRTKAVDLVGRPAEGDAFRTRLTVPPGDSVPFETTLPGGARELVVEASAAGDPLAIDDTVTLVEPSTRVLKVALALPEDDPSLRPLQRGFDAVPEVDYVEPGEAQLVVAPVGEEPPPIRPELWWLSLGPIDRSDAARDNALDLRGPYLIEKRHPLLVDVFLDGVIWGGVQPVETDVAPLVSAGEYVLLGERRDTESNAFLLNVDLARPNLTDSRDWPKLLSNLCELARDDQPGLRRWNYRLGETLRFRLFHGYAGGAVGERKIVIEGPERTRRLPRTAIVETAPLQDVGLHTIRDGEDDAGRFSVNFYDRHESTLTKLTPGEREPDTADPPAIFQRDDPYTWLLMLAIVLIAASVLADWYVLQPQGGGRSVAAGRS